MDPGGDKQLYQGASQSQIFAGNGQRRRKYGSKKMKLKT
jgi:hypothetical protein